MISVQQIISDKWTQTKAIPDVQKFRYALIIVSCFMFLSPFLIIPTMLDNPDMCGKLCMRRFYLYFAAMTWDDVLQQMSVASTGVIFMGIILLTTFFFGRLWCGYLCPMGGLPELVSRIFNDRLKIDYRPLPQTQIRYGYFAVYVILMPSMGISACTLCNFITIPRIFEAFSGGYRGLAFLVSSVGLVNLCLLFLLGFFANKGRAYCQFMCPIGAIDGLVNRAGASMPFSRRIRVQPERCTGCKKCAQVCMTGSIQMKDNIAIVDQFSCMSCYDCVESCEWGAIDWITKPVHHDPVRKKKGVEFFPTPEWVAVHPEDNFFVKPVKLLGSLSKSAEQKKISEPDIKIVPSRKLAGEAEKDNKSAQKPLREKQPDTKKKVNTKTLNAWFIGLMLLGSMLTFTPNQSLAAARNIDPDGCLVCHAFSGLQYIDKEDVLRSASINEKHYYSSLHGSVPCRDCHRETRAYPHKVENTEVDCSAACHVEEPSVGEAYNHQFVVDEFNDSIHGAGWSKGFTGGNRLEEINSEANPSCRWCHNNSLYIAEHKMALFQSEFKHSDEACGNCHQGDVWRGQFGGHILSRLLGARWSKQESVEMCRGCHDDQQHMQDVKQREFNTDNEQPLDKRYLGVVKSYDMTLHARLIEANVDEGASCIDCHAPQAYQHGIRQDEDPKSPTHTAQLGKTCGTVACHGYSENTNITAFIETDMHDTDWLMPDILNDWKDANFNESGWNWLNIILIPASILFLIASIYWSFFIKNKPKTIYSFWGGEIFKTRMLGMKPKKKKVSPKEKKSAKPKKVPAIETTTSKENLKATVKPAPKQDKPNLED